VNSVSEAVPFVFFSFPFMSFRFFTTFHQHQIHHHERTEQSNQTTLTTTNRTYFLSVSDSLLILFAASDVVEELSVVVAGASGRFRLATFRPAYWLTYGYLLAISSLVFTLPAPSRPKCRDYCLFDGIRTFSRCICRSTLIVWRCCGEGRRVVCNAQ
jgi:hypothetical protein